MYNSGHNYSDPYAYGYNDDVSAGYSQPSNHNVYSNSSSSSNTNRGNTSFFKSPSYVSSSKYLNNDECYSYVLATAKH